MDGSQIWDKDLAKLKARTHKVLRHEGGYWVICRPFKGWLISVHTDLGHPLGLAALEEVGHAAEMTLYPDLKINPQPWKLWKKAIEEWANARDIRYILGRSNPDFLNWLLDHCKGDPRVRRTGEIFEVEWGELFGVEWVL